MRKFTVEGFFRGLLILIVLVLVGLVLYRFSTLVGYVLIALVFSYLFGPIVNRMEVAGFRRTTAVTLVVLSFVLLLVWASTSLAPTIGSQVLLLASQLNAETINNIAIQVETELLFRIPFIAEGQITEFINNLSYRIFDTGNFQSTITNLFGIFANIFTAALIIPFATFFFLKDGSKLRRQVLELVPNKFFETTLTILNKIETRLILYFKGVLIQSTLVGLISWLLLSAIGLNNALVIGAAVGIANTIPYFGPIIGYTLSLIVAIFETGDFSLVPYALGAIAIAQLVDNLVLQPLIFSKSSGYHPVYVLLIILVGAEMAGLLGMLVAIPVATILKITFTEINWSLNNYHVFKSDS